MLTDEDGILIARALGVLVSDYETNEEPQIVAEELGHRVRSEIRRANQVIAGLRKRCDDLAAAGHFAHLLGVRESYEEVEVGDEIVQTSVWFTADTDERTTVVTRRPKRAAL